MDIDSTLTVIEGTNLAAMIRESSWAFQTLESLHVIGIALVLGTISVVDLRLIGYPSHRRSALRLIQELLPFTWLAFAICVVTGLLMFISNAVTYVGNTFFWWKMGILALAGLNMAVFHLGIYRRINQWSDTFPPPVSARVAGLGSLMLWTVVVFLGRWIGFV